MLLSFGRLYLTRLGTSSWNKHSGIALYETYVNRNLDVQKPKYRSQYLCFCYQWSLPLRLLGLTQFRHVTIKIGLIKNSNHIFHLFFIVFLKLFWIENWANFGLHGLGENNFCVMDREWLSRSWMICYSKRYLVFLNRFVNFLLKNEARKKQ